MTAYGVAPLGRCEWSRVLEESGSIAGWCWAGHDGLMASDQCPADIAPTGWLWAWGESRWIRWRVDPVAGCVGAELRLGDLSERHHPAVVRDLPAEARVSMRSDSHMLSWADSARRVAGIFAIGVLQPAPITFLALRWADRDPVGKQG